MPQDLWGLPDAQRPCHSFFCVVDLSSEASDGGDCEVADLTLFRQKVTDPSGERRDIQTFNQIPVSDTLGHSKMCNIPYIYAKSECTGLQVGFKETCLFWY